MTQLKAKLVGFTLNYINWHVQIFFLSRFVSVLSIYTIDIKRWLQTRLQAQTLPDKPLVAVLCLINHMWSFMLSECVIFLPLNYSPNSWQSQVKVKTVFSFFPPKRSSTPKHHSEGSLWRDLVCFASSLGAFPSVVPLSSHLSFWTSLIPLPSSSPVPQSLLPEMQEDVKWGLGSWGNTCLTMCFFRAIISKQRHLNITCGISILLLLFYICKMNKAEPWTI